METRLSVLKNSFGQIVDLKETNISILHTLKTRIQQIKSMYDNFIQTNREQLFVFTLDSFHFQGKLIDLEFEDMNRMFLSITNRMYCDYYKLFKIIVDYVKENVPDKKMAELIRVHDNYPVYKDLEPFKQYDFQYIQSLHEVILVIITYLHTFITNKEHELKMYQAKNQIGLHIDSFVSTFSFNTFVMNQKTLLFITYMEFFHKSHTKYLKRFTMKLNLMLSQLNNDIKIENPTDTKTTKKEMMTNLQEHNLDKGLLKELKISIADDTSSLRSKSDSNATLETEPTQIVSSTPSTPENTVVSQENYSDLTDDNEMKKMPRFSIQRAPIYECANEDSTQQSLCDNIRESSSEESEESGEEILLDLCLHSGNGNYETYIENREPTCVEIAENITI